MSASVNAEAGFRDGEATALSQALAQRLLDDGERLPAKLGRDLAREIAWSLKDECYAAWSTQPQRAVRAAEVLSAVAREASSGTPDAEIDALAAWTQGIALLIRGEMAEAVRSFDAAAASFDQVGRTHDAAQTLVPKIMALAMLGRHDDAVATAERAQRELRDHGDDRAAAKVSLNLGSLHLRRDAFKDAASNYRKAAVLFARIGDREHSIMADIGIADALTARGEFDEALRIYARVHMRAAAHGFPVLSAMQAESVALLQLARGNYAEALAGFESSRRAYESLCMPQHLAIAEKQLADAYLELRLIPEATALFDESLLRFEAQEMPDDVAWTLIQRGRADALAGRSDLAVAAFKRTADMFLAQENVVGQSAVALARAELALSTGDSVDALQQAQQAARGFQHTGLAEREVRAQVVEADALLQSGSPAKAGDRFASVLERARHLQVLSVQVRCLTGEGLVAVARHDQVRARNAFNAAIDLFEQQRSGLPGDELRDAFLTDHLRPYRELLRIALAEHEQAANVRSATGVLVELERFRARALGERLASVDTTEDDASTREMRARVNWLRRRVSRIAEEGGDTKLAMRDLRQGEGELVERARRQRLMQPASMQTSPLDADPDVERLRASLRGQETLVEYGVQDDELFACVVTHGGIAVHRALASWNEVQNAVRSARFQMEALRHGGAAVERHIGMLTQRALSRMQRLHELLWAPLAGSLGDATRVLVVPHGVLGALPFCALHDGSRYLAEHVNVAVVPSARIGAWGRARLPLAPRNALVMGVSHLLPHAGREAAFVASLLPAATLLVDANATVQAFYEGAREADLIHLACHAQFRSDNPMFSALHLDDGTLTAEATERLRLRSATVVLSACETALAQETHGDEMFGLVRAFMVAGASRIVASLWPVDDAATAAMMQLFYKALLEGMEPAVALAGAQRVLMQRYPHPFHWAPFAVYGGW